jgi:hypothetical protein
MTFPEAREKAAALDLDAVELAGWSCLFPKSGGAFIARGQEWEDAFARLEAPAPATDPALAAACPRCHATAGEKCRNYRGVNKQSCPARTEALAGPKEPAIEPLSATKPSGQKLQQGELF